jgi:hypothetical protein
LLLYIQVAHLKGELAGKNKENEMLRKMLSTLRIYGTTPAGLSKGGPIVPQPRSTKTTEVQF